MKTILFICTGNTCRSSMAEALARDIADKKGLTHKITFKSAGTWAAEGCGASPNAIKALEELKLDLQAHRSKPVTPELLQEADLILTMTNGHKRDLASFYPENSDKLFTLYEYAGDEESSCQDVADPFGQSLEVYKKCASELYTMLERAIEKFSKSRM